MGTHDHRLVMALNNLCRFILFYLFFSLDEGHHMKKYAEQTHSDPNNLLPLSLLPYPHQNSSPSRPSQKFQLCEDFR